MEEKVSCELDDTLSVVDESEKNRKATELGLGDMNFCLTLLRCSTSWNFGCAVKS